MVPANPDLIDTLGVVVPASNEKFQVMDVFGEVMPSFYCAGESAAGMTLHGLARCLVGGYIAGTNAVGEPIATMTQA